MEFRIAPTYQRSLRKLTNEEQKEAKIASFDLQMNPAHPGFQFHRIERAKDPNLWSARVGRDLRLIVYKTDSRFLLLYVNHHDPAYDWASRRKIERHPETGAAQIVEIRELVREIPIIKHVAVEQKVATKQSRLFDWVRDEQLRGYGVPEEWLPDVRNADESTLLDLIDHLPEEVVEALMELADGRMPPMPTKLAPEDDPFDHPDALRRFRVLKNKDELERALDYPWDQWTIFLHPDQRRFAEQNYNGAARISGSAGTGKTVVALHRAVNLARQHPDAAVLITTFSKALANALNLKLLRLVGNESAVRERITIHSMTELGTDLHTAFFGEPKIVDDETLKQIIGQAGRAADKHAFSDRFLLAEWRNVVDAWQIDSWEAYSSVPRLGRRTRLGQKQRKTLWKIYEQVKESVAQHNLQTWAMVFGRVTKHLEQGDVRPYQFIIVDECQDLNVAGLRLLATLGSERSDALFFAGDLGQRIFQQPFSWKKLGVDVRGRSHTLRTNYRTSHQIRRKADMLLPTEITDVDGNEESRDGTVSVFNGVPPEMVLFDSAGDEAEGVGHWLKSRLGEGLSPEAIGVIVRSKDEIGRAVAAVTNAGAEAGVIDDIVRPTEGKIAVCTMHLAKGLEFSAVAVIACDDGIVPLDSRLDEITDPSDHEDAFNTERHLLYVACTRARDRLYVSGITPGSEFLADMT